MFLPSVCWPHSEASHWSLLVAFAYQSQKGPVNEFPSWNISNFPSAFRLRTSPGFQVCRPTQPTQDCFFLNKDYPAALAESLPSLLMRCQWLCSWSGDVNKSGHSDIKFLSWLLSHLHMNAAYHTSEKGYSRAAKTHKGFKGNCES